MQLVLGLGGNLGDALGALIEARSRLARSVRVLAGSRIFQTTPVGPVAQPSFLNAALLVEGDLSPRELLERCLEFEAAAGRDRAHEVRWGPRHLDIDLLMARDLVRRGSRLALPHPRLHERAFALVPAAEVAAEWRHPLLGRTLAELAQDAVRRDPAAEVEPVAGERWQP